MAHCPYTQPVCILTPRYDLTPPSEHAIIKIIETCGFDVEQTAQMIDAVSTKIYRGESCQRCGSFFSAIQREEK